MSLSTTTKLVLAGLGVAAIGVLAGCSRAGRREPDPQTPGVTTEPTPPAAKDRVRIGQLNAHNLFDTVDGYGSDTILTQAQYELKLGKLGLAIRDAMRGPDIIALQEVENLQVLQDLAARPEISSLGYQALLVEGTDPRGIDVGYLYRPSTVELVASQAHGTTRVSASGRNIQLFTRPPLVATFRARPHGSSGTSDARQGAAFTLINNHFTSKLQGADGEQKRQWQSAWVSSLADGSTGVANLDPSRVIVLGDLNAGLDEDPYLSLRDGSDAARPRFVNAADHLPETDRYSYRDGSKRSLLDHVLLTPQLDAAVKSVEIPHINSDPSEKLYEDPSTFQRSSDHDPVVVELAV
jgi:predicted extracellular nuclease